MSEKSGYKSWQWWVAAVTIPLIAILVNIWGTLSRTHQPVPTPNPTNLADKPVVPERSRSTSESPEVVNSAPTPPTSTLQVPDQPKSQPDIGERLQIRKSAELPPFHSEQEVRESQVSRIVVPPKDDRPQDPTAVSVVFVAGHISPVSARQVSAVEIAIDGTVLGRMDFSRPGSELTVKVVPGGHWLQARVYDAERREWVKVDRYELPVSGPTVFTASPSVFESNLDGLTHAFLQTDGRPLLPDPFSK
jgi:hypothetical protein